MPSKRLFVNNLPADVNENDLKVEFNNFGSVSKIEIKKRKNLENDTRFAYIHIDINNNDLSKCLLKFSDNKWNGHWLSVKQAEESFLERLKREREEAATESIVTDTSQKYDVSDEKFEVVPRVNKKRKFIKDETEVTLSKQNDNLNREDTLNISPIKKQDQNTCLTTDNDEVVDYVIKSNKGKKLSDILKIESFGREPIYVIDQFKSNKKIVNNDNPADVKRRQGLANAHRNYLERKEIIKNALSNKRTFQNKIITFTDTDEIVSTAQAQESNNILSRKDKKLSLFQDDEEDEDDLSNFQVRDEYQDKKVQKLLKLKAKIENQKRFAITSEFVNGDETDEDYQETTVPDQKNTIDKETPHSKKNAAVYKTMVRFDPSKPEHRQKYEQRRDGETQVKESKTKEKEKDDNKEKKQDEQVIHNPIVSKEIYHKVDPNLNQIGNGTGFSFAFGAQLAEVIEDDKTAEPESQNNKKSVDSSIKKKIVGQSKKAFKYDSSDEDEEEYDQTQMHEEKPLEATENVKSIKKEPFFFRKDDPRLEEGINFIREIAKTSRDFQVVRRQLKEIVRSKMRNAKRKNRPFKKKLGGKKQIRTKKALK